MFNVQWFIFFQCFNASMFQCSNIQLFNIRSMKSEGWICCLAKGASIFARSYATVARIQCRLLKTIEAWWWDEEKHYRTGQVWSLLLRRLCWYGKLRHFAPRTVQGIVSPLWFLDFALFCVHFGISSVSSLSWCHDLESCIKLYLEMLVDQ